MKLTYDPDANVAYIRLREREGTVVNTLSAGRTVLAVACAERALRPGG